MKNLNRTLLTLVVAIALALGWSLLSRTDWASSVSVLGLAEDYDNVLQPLLKTVGAIVVMVTATQLIQNGSRFLKDRMLTRTARHPHQPARPSSS